MQKNLSKLLGISFLTLAFISCGKSGESSDSQQNVTTTGTQGSEQTNSLDKLKVDFSDSDLGHEIENIHSHVTNNLSIDENNFHENVLEEVVNFICDAKNTNKVLNIIHNQFSNIDLKSLPSIEDFTKNFCTNPKVISEVKNTLVEKFGGVTELTSINKETIQRLIEAVSSNSANIDEDNLSDEDAALKKKQEDEAAAAALKKKQEDEAAAALKKKQEDDLKKREFGIIII